MSVQDALERLDDLIVGVPTLLEQVALIAAHPELFPAEPSPTLAWMANRDGRQAEAQWVAPDDAQMRLAALDLALTGRSLSLLEYQSVRNRPGPTVRQATAEEGLTALDAWRRRQDAAVAREVQRDPEAGRALAAQIEADRKRRGLE